MIFFSHVFFNSGFVVSDLDSLVASVPSPDTLVVIDGYHGFCAIPTSLRRIESRVFYLSGGYKYAQSGEGVCFLVVPHSCALRPIYTGWFAELASLAESPSHEVTYQRDGLRFAGATFDPSGLYRFNAAMRWLAAQRLGVERIHSYVVRLQEYFLQRLEQEPIRALPLSALRPPHHLKLRGHFLTFELDDTIRLEKQLLEKDVYIDRRANRLRFGFGLYHTEADVDALIERLLTL
jgi:selenocysteine lyase/cysteine desulfurase